jgi:hypothetical protein
MGAQVDGVICSHPPADNGQGGVGNIYLVDVRVHFPDGSMAEFSSGRLDGMRWAGNSRATSSQCDMTPRTGHGSRSTPRALRAAREADPASMNLSQNAAIARSEAELARRTSVDNQAD